MAPDLREITLSRQQVIAIATDKADIPEAMRQQLRQKCIDSLRLSTNGRTPEGYFGPELPPAMLPEGVFPSSPVVSDVLVTTLELQNEQLDHLEESIMDYRYAMISEHIVDAVLDIGVSTHIVRFPQQPFELIVAGCKFDCLAAPVEIICDVPIRSVNVTRSKYFSVLPKNLYMSVIRMDMTPVFKYKYYNRFVAQLVYVSIAQTLTSQAIRINYHGRDTILPNSKKRKWYMLAMENKEYDDNAVIKTTSNGYTRVGPFVFNPGIKLVLLDEDDSNSID